MKYLWLLFRYIHKFEVAKFDIIKKKSLLVFELYSISQSIINYLPKI